MKRTTLKSLIESIIRKTIVEKLIKEGQPVGGVKNDHDFDAGRQGVMKAVNVGESYGNGGTEKIFKDREGGRDVYWMDNKDTGGKIFIKPENVGKYLRKGYRLIDMTVNEKVGFDGKYVDDMESGVAVKKLHKLDEMDPHTSAGLAFVGAAAGSIIYKIIKDIINHYRIAKGDDNTRITSRNIDVIFEVLRRNNPKLKEDDIEPIQDEIEIAIDNGKIKTLGDLKKYLESKCKGIGSLNEAEMNPLTSYYNVGVRCGTAASKKDVGLVTHLSDWFNKAIALEQREYAKQAKEEFYRGYREGSGAGQKPEYFKQEGKVKEQSASGAAGGYSTPFAFKKKKEMDEMSSTGGPSGSGMGYQTPGSFTRNKKGSKRALDVTKKLGFTEA